MADVRPFLLRPSDTIADALGRLTANGLGFGVVVVNDRAVVGTVLDAELRRAIVSGTSLQTSVSEVMTSRLTRAKRLPADLAVDGGRLVEVAAKPATGPAPVAVIMAGGKGKRLRPITQKVPKPLLKVGTSTIIERIIHRLVAAGIGEIHIALNYKAAMFERRLGSHDYGAAIHFVRELAPLGTAGPLGLLMPKPAAPVLVTNADIVTRLDYARLLEFHRWHGGQATMAAMEHVTHIPYGVLRTKGDRLTAFDEKPDVRVLVNAGMYVLAPGVLNLVRQNETLDMPALLERVQRRDEAVHVFPVVEKWIDSGTPEEFERVLIDFATGEDE